MIQLYNDDCLNVLKAMEDKSVDFVCVDIPYELTQHGGGTTALHKRAIRMRDSIDFMAHGIDYDAIFTEYIRVCKIPNMVIFCSNLQLGKIITFFTEKKLKTDVLVWEKSNPAPLCNGKYVSDLEYMVYVHDKGSPFNNNASFQEKKKCKIYPIVVSKDKIHPTQKPLDLIKELVNVHSFEGQTVLDSFMGSGTTGIACKELNRNFIGCEIDKTYFEAAKHRIEDTTVLEFQTWDNKQN